jgi:hypothetical protein
MMSGMQTVPVSDMRMVGRLFVIAALVMSGRFAMMPGGMLVVLGGFFMMIRAFMVGCHNDVLLFEFES